MVTVWPINNLGLHQLGALNGKLKWAPEIARDTPKADSRTQGYSPSEDTHAYLQEDLLPTHICLIGGSWSLQAAASARITTSLPIY